MKLKKPKPSSRTSVQIKSIQEITDIIREAVALGKSLPLSWLTHKVVENHPKIVGDDADWYRTCAYEAVRQRVREAVRAYDKGSDAVPDSQLVLEGFTRVQKAYAVERKGDQIMVATHEMSDTEGRKKIRDLRRLSAGAAAHADELERYFDDRKDNEDFQQFRSRTKKKI